MTTSKLTLGALAGLSLAALALAAGCGGGAGPSNQALATVNGEAITIDQFNGYLGIKPTVRVVLNGQVAEVPVADTLAFQAMQDLVSRQVLYQMAKDAGITVTDADVEKEIAYQKALNTNFIRNYQSRGMTMGQIRQEVQFNLTQERLVTKGVTITDETVEKWIKDNPKAFVEAATVSLSFILVPEAEKGKVDAALGTGRSFREVATEMSRAPDAKTSQGRFRNGMPIAIESLEKNLAAAVAKTEPLSTTGWMQFPEGWARFYIEAKTAEKKIEVTAERRESVKRGLAIEQGAKANDVRKQLVSRIEQSKIEVQRETLKEAWNRFQDMLTQQAEAAADKAAPATGGTAGGAGAGTTPGGN